MFMSMYRRAQLKRLAEVYLEATGIAPTALGERICKTNNRLILRLVADKGINADNAELASDWFLANWLPAIPWPADVPRHNGTRGTRKSGQVNGDDRS
jgi:hypothetical protein